ncbi:MAG TPA: hypothetical protein VK517_00535 [Cyclobacteriaceae bacterium]|nr:hypothetical protein [Cyclobacteriaceae bacterium]
MASNSTENSRADAGKQIISDEAPFLLKGLVIILFLIVALYLEWPRERKPNLNKCDLFERTDHEIPGESYAKTVAFGFHSVRSRRVTIIPLNAQSVPSKVLKNVCEQRHYLARLIEALSASGATAIVIDKFFDPESCDQNDPRTADLVHAIQISSVPIIIGAATHAPETDPKHACLILSGSLDFGKKLDARGDATERSAVIWGLTRLNVDLRRIPLKWVHLS